jgi:hypothetical protein
MLLLHPDEEYTIAELTQQLGIPQSTVSGEVRRLADAGILAVRRGITLAATTKGVRIRSITAFQYDTHGPALGLGTGNIKHCPGAQPLNVVFAPPHQQSAWYVVIAVTFAGPGHYYIGKARIDYTAGGVKGWQYQNLFTTMRIAKLRPGQKLKYSDPCP